MTIFTHAFFPAITVDIEVLNLDRSRRDRGRAVVQVDNRLGIAVHRDVGRITIGHIVRLIADIISIIGITVDRRGSDRHRSAVAGHSSALLITAPADVQITIQVVVDGVGNLFRLGSRGTSVPDGVEDALAAINRDILPRRVFHIVVGRCAPAQEGQLIGLAIAGDVQLIADVDCTCAGRHGPHSYGERGIAELTFDTREARTGYHLVLTQVRVIVQLNAVCGQHCAVVAVKIFLCRRGGGVVS